MKIIVEDFKYKLFDNVDLKEVYLTSFEGLKEYCDHWAYRLNDECIQANETPYHTVDTMKEIKEILECVNIELIELNK